MYTFKLSRRRNEWGEYVVRCYKDGKRYRDADYHTDNFQDAFNTCRHLRLSQKGQEKCQK